MSNLITINAVKAALSVARMGTYEVSASIKGPDDPAALSLYAWNAAVSGAMLAPLHVCEVVVRNAISEVLETVYGTTWPWSATFEQSLPNPQTGYSPLRDLQSARQGAPTVGKVIPELKFVFWQKMFTSRHDTRLWTPHLGKALPSMPTSLTVAQKRKHLFDELEELRRLRNRIAHHEPIFTRNLLADYQRIHALVGFRCPITAAWMDQHQTATAVIAAKP